MNTPANVVDPTARDKYLLQVSVGPSYDASTHQEIPVNSRDAVQVDSDIVTAWVKVRIRGYNGLPRGSPASSTYFEHSSHTSDRYSISFSFVPKKNVSGNDLIMGFDYDHAIRHQLPPGFKSAMRIVTSLLDPGLYSDPYSDEPYVYGPALSSFFAFRIGECTEKMSAQDQLARLAEDADGVVEEGAEGSGQSIREDLGLPTQWKKRRKHFLHAKALADFTFEKGRMYHADFFNPYIDFANFALILPAGFSISVARYIDDKTHHLRFVLKNRETKEVFFVVLMKLLFGRELEDVLKREKDSEQGKASSSHVVNAHEEEKIERNITDQAALSESSHVSQPAEPSTADLTTGDCDDKGLAGTAATGLGSLVHSVYTAMGFVGTASSSSSSGASSNATSRRPSRKSLEAEIDNMDDSTVENFLQRQQMSER